MTTTTTATPKLYCIRCSDDGCLILDKDKLEQVFDKMPTLRHLLIGHPTMKPDQAEEQKDGTTLLIIPEELSVSKISFIRLIQCLSRGNSFPNLTIHDVLDLKVTMTTLGGCQELEDRLQNHVPDPMSPQEDKRE